MQRLRRGENLTYLLPDLRFDANSPAIFVLSSEIFTDIGKDFGLTLAGTLRQPKASGAAFARTTALTNYVFSGKPPTT
jgi:hypothetical protein